MGNMTKDEAKRKYGDSKVAVIDKNVIQQMIRENWETYYCLSYFTSSLPSMPRWEAEFDTEHLQIIPYTVLYHYDRETGEPSFFVTHRIAGDPRLTGRYSLGTGGHMEPNESFMKTMGRELMEEVGYDWTMGIDFPTLDIKAKDLLIYEPTSEVNSVHVGMILFLHVEDPSLVSVVEKNKLEGKWLHYRQVAKLGAEGHLESWSSTVLDRLRAGGTAIWPYDYEEDE